MTSDSPETTDVLNLDDFIMTPQQPIYAVLFDEVLSKEQMKAVMTFILGMFPKHRHEDLDINFTTSLDYKDDLRTSVVVYDMSELEESPDSAE
jgi:hypothetical protein